MTRCLRPACGAHRVSFFARVRRWYVEGWLDSLEGRL